MGLAALGAACSEPTAGTLSGPEREPTMAKNAAGEGKEVWQLPFARRHMPPGTPQTFTREQLLGPFRFAR